MLSRRNESCHIYPHLSLSSSSLSFSHCLPILQELSLQFTDLPPIHNTCVCVCVCVCVCEGERVRVSAANDSVILTIKKLVLTPVMWYLHSPTCWHMVMTRSLYLCFSQSGFPVSSSFHSLVHCPRMWLSSCACVCVGVCVCGRGGGWLANEGRKVTGSTK